MSRLYRQESVKSTNETYLRIFIVETTEQSPKGQSNQILLRHQQSLPKFLLRKLLGKE
jgi:hypothetical protein